MNKGIDLHTDSGMPISNQFKAEPILYISRERGITINTRHHNQHPFFPTKQSGKSTKRITGTNFTKPKKKRK